MTYLRAVGQGKLLVGSALITVHGGGCGRGLVDIVGVVLVLGACCSPWFVILVFRAIVICICYCACLLACVFVSMCVHLHSCSLMLVVHRRPLSAVPKVT